MADEETQHRLKKASSSTKRTEGHDGGDALRQTEKWGGGSKGSKGAVTKEDKGNPNSSAKT